MGIHGLTSFIDNNPHLLKDRRLHDCRVVIDGNNFYHFLYFYCNVRFQFGGDYDIFQRKIAMIFSMFKSCNIEVFVVFDGAYTVDGKKFKTTIGRARDRVYAAKRIMYGHRGTLIPCLAQVTFRQTLDKLGIQHVTCDFEADNQLVTLANRLNCPVISNDSDFYIFDLSGGFIPLDYIDFRPRQLSADSEQFEGSCAFLPVQYYHVDEFIKCFRSLNRSVLPLFATMLGNDYVNAKAFEAFYKKKTPKIASRRYSASKKHQKIVSVLYWLEEKEHKGELVSEVLTFIRPERQPRVEKLLTDSISGYVDTHDFESFDLEKFFEDGRSAAMQRTDCVVDLRGECLPVWFVTACRSGEIPVYLLNAVLLRRVILQTQVESIPLPASFLTSRSIREVVYGLLLGQEKPQNSQDAQQQGTEPSQLPKSGSETVQTGHFPGDKEGNSGPQPEDMNENSVVKDQDSEMPVESSEVEKEHLSVKVSETRQNKVGIEEYTRYNLDLRRIAVLPCIKLPNFGCIPFLECVPTLSLQDRRGILLETLGVSADFVDRFDGCLQLFMACLVFWARKSEPAVTLHHLKGVVLSAVLLHVHREIADRENQMLDRCVMKTSEDTEGSHVPQSGDRVHHCVDRTDTLSGEPKAAGDSHAQNFMNNKDEDSEIMHADKDRPVVSITSVCGSADDKLLEKVRNNLRKYYHDPAKFSNKNLPDHEIFHRMAQFQACVMDTIHLSSVLQQPLPTPQPAVLFNGSFIYSIIQELQLRSNPDLFLGEMLVKGSVLTTLFDSLCAEVIREAGDGAFVQQKTRGKKCCKSAKKRKKEKECAGSQGKDLSDRASSIEGEGGQTMMASCDLNNRFGALLFVDDS